MRYRIKLIPTILISLSANALQQMVRSQEFLECRIKAI
jgi:hypothetical protein